ncbi:hypothetical protein J41TS12_40000 [Paenibacillus antibioticophila]|uniref:N-terminal domain of peptidoglycan hydrolase CwlO-containing protein n=1 Tax=Paenibacillus antibioticophila TaxID=1274374 RepID=A0A919XUB2_9BACL|nr:hypothetical protein [Paenibacillus antibioticophila]GIO39139.1 hypothetical protein J41TS12_40000 [Paenibacillus antibioticophila]
MNRKFMAIFLAALLLVNLLQPHRTHAAAMSDEELRILQDSLSIIELDREIARIEVQQEEAHRTAEKLQLELEQKNEQIHRSREQAGKRLAAYYMGERESLMAAILSVNSLKDFFAVMDYYQIIAERDRDVLDAYKSEYAGIKATKRKIDNLSVELAGMKENLLKQKARISELQNSVQGVLSASSDPEKLAALIRELGMYWENVGLYEVRRYFRELASAMADFPDFLQEHKESLSSDRSGYTLTVREEDLNSFLHGKSDLLKDMSFQFENGLIIAKGKRDSLELRLEGSYSVVNDPENCIKFHVERLIFNGLELPDTTSNELEQDFDLGFYPKKIVPFVEATEAAISEGTLQVKLKLGL